MKSTQNNLLPASMFHAENELFEWKHSTVRPSIKMSAPREGKGVSQKQTAADRGRGVNQMRID